MDDAKNPLGTLKASQTEMKSPNRPVRVLGIDLGTTNSTVSEIKWDPSMPTVPPARVLEIEQPTLEGAYTHSLVPSVVALHNGQVLVGEGAKRLRARAAELGLDRNRDIFYECKNEIGIQKTYHRAPEGYRSAAEIGGHVVEFMVNAALADDPTPVDRVVVTVPASFQVAQRHDTVLAMRLAGLEVVGGDLIDEPVAAFLDYLTSGHDEDLKITKPKTLLVFDFGGGTCDVAVLRVDSPSDGASLEVGARAVSRYHRLGGGDIDRAIVHNHLIQMLLEENGLGKFDLDFEQKKSLLEPSLLDLAEVLKEGICSEIRRLQSFGKYEQERNGLVRKLPESRTISAGDLELRLASPELSATTFEEILELFLDRDLLYPTETDYLLTTSIFAPLTDALDRSRLTPEDIDLALMVGGSSLIPQMSQAVEAFLPKARVLTHRNRDDIKSCVSRGAAYQAMSLALFGEGLVQPVCAESLAIQTVKGPMELVAAGTPLPFPASGDFASNTDLRVPKTCTDKLLDLRVELVSGADQRRLGAECALIEPPVTRGEELELRYRLDDNQTLQLTVTHEGDDGPQTVEMEFLNPLTNVVNPQTTRIRIEETEEEIRTNNTLTRDQKLEKLKELGKDYAEIGQREKAAAYFSTVLNAKAQPDPDVLYNLGWIHGEIGDTERERKFYIEAAKADPRWGAPLSALALAQQRRGEFKEAAGSVEAAIERYRHPNYLVLRADLAEQMGDEETRDKYLAEGITAFGPIKTLNTVELSWLAHALRLQGDTAGLKEVEAERRKRTKEDRSSSPRGGELPDRLVMPPQ